MLTVGKRPTWLAHSITMFAVGVKGFRGRQGLHWLRPPCHTISHKLDADLPRQRSPSAYSSAEGIGQGLIRVGGSLSRQRVLRIMA